MKKGKVKEVHFVVAGDRIPTLNEQPVKRLGRWYAQPLTDRHRGMQVKQLVQGLSTIDGCGLPGRYKIWCSQFGLLPHVLWSLQIYEIALTRVERMEKMVNSYMRKWLGLPKMLASLVLYSRSSKIKLPFKSLAEEYKIWKARFQMMLRDSKDPVISELGPKIRTGTKWDVQRMVEDAESRLQMKEIIGAVQ